jgi:hypothetical protein
MKQKIGISKIAAEKAVNLTANSRIALSFFTISSPMIGMLLIQKIKPIKRAMDKSKYFKLLMDIGVVCICL